MKVVELKKELKARGQDTAGLKKDLRARLMSVILEQLDQEETRVFSVPNNKASGTSDSNAIEESKEEHKEISDSMEVSKVSEERAVELEDKMYSPARPMDSDDLQRENQRKESMNSMQVEHHTEDVESVQEMKLQPKESAQENSCTEPAFSEREQNTLTSMPKESLKRPESSLTAINEMAPTSSNSNSDSASALASVSNGHSECSPNSQDEKSELTEMKMNEFSEINKANDNKEDASPPRSEVSCSTKASGSSVKDMVSKFSGFSSSLSSSSSGSALSKGLQAKKEARQAKIAEMRAKVRRDSLNSMSMHFVKPWIVNFFLF